MLGCLIVLGGLGFAGYRYGPGLFALLRGQTSAITWGLDYEENGLRVKVIAAGMETTELEDALGSRSGNEDLHITVEITNMSDATITYRVPRLLRASEPTLTDDKGRAVPAPNYSDDAKIDGQLYDGQEIQARNRARHDYIFKTPPADADSFILKVDLAVIGRREVVQFRIPASEIKGR